MWRCGLVCGGLLLAAGPGGCGGAEEAAEPEVPEKCRSVHVDKLADNDWLAVKGSAADPKVRMRVMAGPGNGVDYVAWYNDGFFTKRTLHGVKRGEDVQFTEVPGEKKKAAVEAGESTLVRLYVKPSLADCALEVFSGVVDHEGKEEIPPRGFELVAFPDKEGVEFSFRPPDEPLFLGAAASDPAVAAKQVEELGGPRPDHEMGTVPVGTFSDAAEDGDPACTYDMDLYFDDQKVMELAATPAGEVADGKRPWFHSWEAPYSGNHHFEIYRYRTCSGGKRELIAVAGIEAILN